MSESAWSKFVELVRTTPALPVDDEVLRKAAEIVKENPNASLSEVAEKISVSKYILSRRVQKFVQALEPEVKEERSRSTKDALESAAIRSRSSQQLSVRILDAGIAKTLEEHLSKLAWFSEAMNRIGFASLLAALQYAKIDPQDFLKKASEFEDADRFVNEVLKYLSAMFIAAKGSGEEIAKMQAELERYRNESVLWRLIAMDAAKQANMYRTELFETLAIMCPDCRLKYGLLMQMKFHSVMEEKKEEKAVEVEAR